MTFTRRLQTRWTALHKKRIIGKDFSSNPRTLFTPSKNNFFAQFDVLGWRNNFGKIENMSDPGPIFDFQLNLVFHMDIPRQRLLSGAG